MSILAKIVLVYYLIINVVLFFMMAWDKRAAIKDHWRVPEHKLLFVSLIGGGLGGYIGMMAFRHKTRKPVFSLVFICSIFLHLVAWFFIYKWLVA